ncbi:Probable RNA-directed DNA polymerase from transposon X-element [Eumeta japonica]|uniref:Probable RNA-directed DNA polymerase from transposon X-element n=1 Tax=Eumeta variegata TaxID=151549 RepID=A0A4C1ZIQ3_EUMVA|nr:Probable RNA-directed DNA polymerase from transposon X-element [Eumeta japonica]
MLFYTVVKLLVAIFNACIKNCYFPPAWKEAEVIGIHKPGKPRDLPASYRPISLLSGLGKLFEKILKTRLSNHLIGKGLIIDEQFGFRPAHSCPQQVLRLVEYVSEGFETERSTVAVFFDVTKAFDRVWHAGMSALTRHDVLSEQEFLKAPPSLACCTPRTQTIYRDRRRQASNSHYSRTIPCSFTEVGIGAPDSPSSLQRTIDELGSMVPEVEDRSKPRQISSHTIQAWIRVDLLSTKHLILKCEHSVAMELQILRSHAR